MLISIILGVLIFGYAFWALYHSIKESKKGVCASCEMVKRCNGHCDEVSKK